MTAIGRIIDFRAVRKPWVMPLLILLLVVVTLAATTTCDKPFSFVGTWKGLREVQGVPGADPGIIQNQREVEVKIDDRGAFNMTIGGMGYSGPVSYGGGNADLIPISIMGMPVERQPESVQKTIPAGKLVPARNGTVTFTIDGKDPVVLTKEPAANATTGSPSP